MRFKKNQAFITDTATGLHWAAETGAGVSWAEAPGYLEKLNRDRWGGLSGWRLPTRRELRTVMDYGVTSPAMDLRVFENMPLGNYWCAEEYPLMDRSCAWVIFSGLGSSIVMNKGNRENVIAVNGPVLKSDFRDMGGGIILDEASGLMWQKGENPRMRLTDAEKYCRELTLGGFSDWRLPTLKELGSLLDMSYSGGGWYFKDFFPAEGLKPPLLHYFSGTEFENHYAWVINFCFGYDGYYGGKNANLLFRAVRGEKSGCEASTADAALNRRVNLKNTALSKEETTAAGALTWERKTTEAGMGLYTHDEAKAYIDGLNRSAYGGFTDWRLPRREELRRVYGERWRDTLPEFYWSAEDGAEPSLAYGIYFAYGCAICYPKSNRCNVRAVRGAYKPAKLILLDNGCVLDETSGLYWKRGESPPLTLADAEKYCAGLSIGGFNDWRVPTMGELASLVDLNGSPGAWFDKSMFPDTQTLPQGFYMSSTPFGGTFLWGVNFQFGYDGYYADPGSPYPFRPVRGGGHEI